MACRGPDVHSLWDLDPLLDPETLQVAVGSPAFRVGFRNFRAGPRAVA